MTYSFRGVTISGSFQRVVQVDSGNFYDGLGNLLPITGSFSDIYAQLSEIEATFSNYETKDAFGLSYSYIIATLSQFITQSTIPNLQEVLIAGNSASQNIQLYNSEIDIFDSDGNARSGIGIPYVYVETGSQSAGVFLEADNENSTYIGFFQPTGNFYLHPTYGLTDSYIQVFQGKNGTVSLLSDLTEYLTQSALLPYTLLTDYNATVSNIYATFANYLTSSALTGYLTASSLTPYTLLSNFNGTVSNIYATFANYLTSSALVPYVLSSNYTGTVSNIYATFANYLTSSALVPYVLSSNYTGTVSNIYNTFSHYLNATFSNLGEILYGGVSGTPTILSGVTASSLFYLTQQGTGTQSSAPQWLPISNSGQLVFYLDGTASDITSDRSLLTIPNATASSLVYSITGGASATAFLQSAITIVNSPNISFIPAGLAQFNVYAFQSSGSRTIQLYGEIWEVTATGSQIGIITTTGFSIPLTSVSANYNMNASITAYTMTSNASRLLLKMYADVSGPGSATNGVTINFGSIYGTSILLPSNQSISALGVGPSLTQSGINIIIDTTFPNVWSVTQSVSALLVGSNSIFNTATTFNIMATASSGGTNINFYAGNATASGTASGNIYFYPSVPSASASGTGSVFIQINNLKTSSQPGLILQNTVTASAAVTTQASPYLIYQGASWAATTTQSTAIAVRTGIQGVASTPGYPQFVMDYSQGVTASWINFFKFDAGSGTVLVGNVTINGVLVQLIGGASTGNITVVRPSTSYTTTTGGITVSNFVVNPTYNEASGTVSNLDFVVNRIETNIGNGNGRQRLFSGQISGIEKFGIDNKGKLNFVTGTNSAPLGTFSLASGLATVPNTSVTTGTYVYMDYASGVAPSIGIGSLSTQIIATTLTAGVSFGVTAYTAAGVTNTTDNSVIMFYLIN